MIKKILPLIYIKDIENLNNSERVILCLESKFFNIFKIEIDNILNAENRLEKIEERLEIIFPQYTLNEYILEYEILETKKKKEIIVVYLLNRNKLGKDIIIDDIQKYKILSIFPEFLKYREYKGNVNFYNFNIDDEVMVVSKYSNKKLENIETFLLGKNYYTDMYENERDVEVFEKTEINIVNTYFESMEENYDVIFTGKNIKLEDLYTERENIYYFDLEKVDFRKYINFLPSDIRKKYYFYYVNEKYLLTMLILTIAILFSIFIINYKISAKEEELSELQYISSTLEDNISEMRIEMEEIEKDIETLEIKLKKSEYTDFEINSLLYEISDLVAESINLESIEYDDKKVLNIIGQSKNEENIIKFIENINLSKNFKLLNWDYISKNKNFFEFKIELKYSNKI